MLYHIDIMMDNKIKQSILPVTAFAIILLGFMGNPIQNTVFGQSNASENSANQTKAEITGEPETTIINKTTIPAQQTTVEVNETTSPVDKSALKPLQNMNMQDQSIANLSGFENKTIVKPTGEAKTTTVNQTTIPFEKTMVESGNQTGSQQQEQQQSSPQQQEQQQSSPQQQGNKSSGPLEKIGEKITDIFK
jgi:hypothetical protein